MSNFISIFLLAVSFALSYWYTSPLIDDVTAMRAESASLNASLGESRDLRTVMAEKETAYNGFSEEEKETINKIIPDSIDNVKLVIDIDDVASKYNMKIRNIDLKTEGDAPVEGEIAKPYGAATLRFSVTAPYDRFRLFMNDLENSMRLVDISSLSFSSGDKDLNEYNVELRTYWLKENI